MMNNLNQPKVTVIMPVYNAASTIEKCLDSIINQDYPNLEIIIVDDGSSDDTLVRAAAYNLRVIRQEKNRGSSCCRNAGANEASGEILIFCDSDIIVPPQAISGLVKALIAKRDKLAVSGVYSEKTEGLNFISEYKNCDLAYREQILKEDAKFVTSFFFAIRKSEFIKAGGFSEHFLGATVEDIEFGYRVTKNLTAMFIQKEIKVRHLKRYNLVSMLKTDFQRIFNMIKIIKISKGKYKAGEDIPLSYRINLFLPWAIIFSLVASAFFKIRWLVAITPLFFIINNYGFLVFLVRKRGVIFALKSLAMLFVEYIFVPVFMLISGLRLLLINTS